MVLYLGGQNNNFQVFKRLAENNISFKNFYFCFDWKINDELLRLFKLKKYSGRDYVIYIRHNSRLLGINELFEEKYVTFSKENYNYFELKNFFRNNYLDKYIENNDEETAELVNNLYFYGDVALIFAYDGDDEHKYVENKTKKFNLKETHIPGNSNRENRLLALGFENQPHLLSDILEFRKAVVKLPRNIRYLSVDIHNKLGNPLTQLFLQNGHMLHHGSVAMVHVGRILFFD